MRVLLIILALFIFFTLNLFAENEWKLRVTGDISSSPFFYEPQYSMYGTSLNTSWMFGIKRNIFTMGLETLCNYLSFDGQNESENLDGALFNISGRIITNFEFASWIELKLGVGGLWQSSAFRYNNSGWESQRLGGLVFLINTKFMPWEYVNFDITNNLDLLLSPDYTGLRSINYTGGLRINFHPSIKWMSLFIQADARLWNYHSDSQDVNSWMFQGSVGVSFDFPRIRGEEERPITKPDEEIEETDIPIDEITIDEIPIITEEITMYPEVESLKTDPVGSEIILSSVIFVEGSDSFKSESTEVLDGIASILLDNEALIISISGYSKYFGDLIRELELSRARAEKIKNYLVNMGVGEHQIKISEVGQIISVDLNNQEISLVKIIILNKN